MLKPSFLNHLSQASFYGTQANSAESDQTPHNLDLHCLHTVGLFQFEKKIEMQPNTPRIRNGLVLPIRVGKSSRLKLIEIVFSMCIKPQIQPDKQQIIRVALLFSYLINQLKTYVLRAQRPVSLRRFFGVHIPYVLAEK